MSYPKSKRPQCAVCQRPVKTCICHLVARIATPIELAILQHPSEVGHPKGTAWLAHQCLVGSQLFVGEQLEDLPALEAWLAQGDAYLLYPMQAGDLVESIFASALLPRVSSELAKARVLVLDGTWRKTYKLLQSNPTLQRLPRITLRQPFSSGYHIRQARREDSLSTLESIYCLLREIDVKGDYAALINSFEGFVGLYQGFIQK